MHRESIWTWLWERWIELGWTAVPFVGLFLLLLFWSVRLWCAHVDVPLKAYLITAVLPLVLAVFGVALDWYDVVKITGQSGVFDVAHIFYRTGEVILKPILGAFETVVFLSNGALLSARKERRANHAVERTAK